MWGKNAEGTPPPRGRRSRRWGLPLSQYTVREPVSGLRLSGYADERSKSYAVLLAERISAHLTGHGVDLSGVEWQIRQLADSEFLVDADQCGLPTLVRTLSSGHHYIPPEAHTWQSDVETVHRLQKTSSSTARALAVAPGSGPRSPPTGATSTSRGPTATKSERRPCKSCTSATPS